jgi:hypothetical protein
MAIVLDGTNGITTPDLESAGQVTSNGITTSLYPLVSGTAVASTSGTSIDFTGIPSWVKRITVMLNGVSTSGASNPLIQIGAGSVTTSGYTGAATNTTNATAVAVANYTTGIGLLFGSASNVMYGEVRFTLLTGNNWIASGTVGLSAQGSVYTAGGVTLSGTLDRVRITTVNGTDTFDAGSINILYE